MKNELQSKPAVAPTQTVKTASHQSGANVSEPRPRALRLNQTAGFSACVSADSSFRF